MRAYVKPWGWPLRRRVLLDTENSVEVHRLLAEGHIHRTVALYVTHHDRWFLSDGHSIHPLWRWQARAWLMTHGAPPEILVIHRWQRSFRQG